MNIQCIFVSTSNIRLTMYNHNLYKYTQVATCTFFGTSGSFMWKASSSCHWNGIIRSLPASSLGFDNVTSLAATLIHCQSSFFRLHARPQRSVEFFCGEYYKNITPYLIILNITPYLIIFKTVTSSWVWVSETGCTW